MSLPGGHSEDVFDARKYARNQPRTALLESGIFVVLAAALLALGLTVFLYGSDGAAGDVVAVVAWTGTAFLSFLALWHVGR